MTALTVADSDVSTDSPIVASHNSYLLEQTNTIRSRTIPWEGYQRAGLITEQELTQIRQFEKIQKANFTQGVEEYADLFISLLGKLVRADTLQSILVFLDDMLQGSSQTIPLFFKDGKTPYPTLFRLLKKEDEFVQLKAAHIAVYLILERSDESVHPSCSELWSWIIFNLASNNFIIVDLASQFLMSLLNVPEYRREYYTTTGSVEAIVSVLEKPAISAQLQYQLIYSIWLMTFSDEIAKDILRRHKILPIFADAARTAIKEKVVRVVVSSFRNLITKAPAENIITMLGSRILPLAETLATRKFSDTEINEDLAFIVEELSQNVASLTTFDEYASELRGGRLEWSPPHQSEQFWKTNASRLTENDNELIKLLSQIVNTSQNPVILSVAAHDIGQFVKFNPTGKRVAQELGAKAAIMQLMSHGHPDVRYHSLLAVQKFMANAWES